MFEEQKPKKKLNIWMPLLLSLVFVFGMLVGMKMQAHHEPVAVIGKKETAPPSALGQGKIEELIRYIEAKYVDEVDRDELVQEAIDNILKKLDPHSNYISEEQLRGVNEQLEGNFEGIGVEFMILDDTIVVVSPLAGGPSEKVGIMAGDKIVEIKDTIVAGVDITSDGIMELLRGEKGSEVVVAIIRGNEKELRKFTITRDKIPMHSLDVAYMLDDETGYIKINRFSATTYEEFMKGVEDLVENHNMKDLVIDLRQNPGGYLQEATNILSQLFEDKDKLLVYTEGRSVHRSDYESTGRSFFKIEDLAVLIDEGSASASEILAGAVQDWDRGVVIGRRSFGKGLVQEQYRLSDGSALRLTVARYYTPSGRSIQKSYDDLDAYDRDVLERFENGELYTQDSVLLADTTRYYTSTGRLVYGGGGINPDVFIPLDSSSIGDYYLKLRQHIPGFVFRYMTAHKTDFDEMSLKKFQKNYSITNEVLNEFINYAMDKGETKDVAEWREAKMEIAHFIKARMAKHLYDDEGFFTIWNEGDEAVEKAVQMLKGEKPLTELEK